MYDQLARYLFRFINLSDGELESFTKKMVLKKLKKKEIHFREGEISQQVTFIKRLSAVLLSGKWRRAHRSVFL